VKSDQGLLNASHWLLIFNPFLARAIYRDLFFVQFNLPLRLHN